VDPLLASDPALGPALDDRRAGAPFDALATAGAVRPVGSADPLASTPPPSPRVGVDPWVAAPLLVVHVLGLGLAPVTFTPTGLVALAVGYLVTGFGVTAGAHRLVTHRSFRASPLVHDALVLAFLLSAQGSLQRWVRDHALHHRYSDRPGDPHSPRLDGLLTAHLGWLWRAPPSRDEARDLYARFTRGVAFGRVAAFFRTGPRLAALHGGAVVAAYVVGALVEGGPHPAALVTGWRTGLSVVVWGVLLRIVLVLHGTLLVNSAAHRWGGRRHDALDDARNNAVVAVTALGEGWHHNHHARPSAANHGHAWWELDPTFALIRLLGALGLARDVKVWDAARGRLEVRWPGGGEARGVRAGGRTG
jgi:stearoyl-CoA desaturase (delta-9 desaturase)